MEATKKSPVPKQLKKLPRDVEDEVASEPDIVQDRGQDFDEFLRQYQSSVKKNENIVKNEVDFFMCLKNLMHPCIVGFICITFLLK